MGEGNKVAASKDTSTINTLTTTMVRLPIGHSATDTGKTAATLFKLLVPTNTGGDLRFDLTGTGEMTLYAHDGTKVLAGPTKSGSLTKHLAPSTGESPTHGLYYLLVKGPSPRTVSCKLRQTALARDGASDKDPPLIPWNFFSWPTAQKFTDGSTNPHIALMETIVRKYAKVFGHDADKGVKFEEKCHQVAVGSTWLGHCHMASRATVLFERPIDRTVAAPGNEAEKVSFSEEDLWFLAAEWFAAWGKRSEAYTYASVPQPFPDHDEIDENGVQQHVKNPLPWRYWGDFVKPSEVDLPRDAFIERIKQAILAYNPALATDGRVDKMAKQAARLDRTNLKKLFGQRAAFFYSTLSEQVYVHKQALAGDLRGAGVGNGPEEVWNHAVFYYEASFKEVLPIDENGLEDPSSTINQDFMEITLMVVGNEDYSALPSTQKRVPKPPAILEQDGSVNTSGSSVENRKSHHVMHIAFDASTGNVRIPSQQDSESTDSKVVKYWTTDIGGSSVGVGLTTSTFPEISSRSCRSQTRPRRRPARHRTTCAISEIRSSSWTLLRYRTHSSRYGRGI
jgi:hypothetical protein